MEIMKQITDTITAMGATPTIKIKSNKMIEIKINAPTVERNADDEKAEKTDSKKA